MVIVWVRRPAAGPRVVLGLFLAAVLAAGGCTAAGTGPATVSRTAATAPVATSLAAPPSAGASYDGPPCPSAGPVIVPTSAASSDPAASQAAIIAYNCLWRAMQTAGLTADWTDPGLARYASGEALTTLVHALYTDHTQGVVIKGVLVTHPQVTVVVPTGAPLQVEITDCSDDSHWLVYVASTGRLLNNVPGGRREVQAVASVLSGQWTISQLAIHGEGTCG